MDTVMCHRSVAVLVTLASITFSACGNDSDPTTSTVDATVSVSTERSTSPSSESVPVSSELSASGVILAAILLTSGDIESAVISGLVTPEEVDAARVAIARKTLDRWVDLAQQD